MKRVIGLTTGAAVLAAGLGWAEGAAAKAERPEAVAAAVRWGPCEKTAERVGGSRVECAMIEVPVDYAKPSGRKLRLAVNRIKATGPRGSRLGVLLVNPGGPGASGRELATYVAAQMPRQVIDRYDVIGFDPRGVGASEPSLTCVDPVQYYKPPRPDNVPRDRRDEERLLARARQYAEGCATRWSWLLPHMTTQNAARDMDAIRHALRESKISYLGYSYGTYLGAVYATMFPSRVRRMVLDSVVDPKGVWYDNNLAQDHAFERRHRDFLAWVAEHDSAYRLGRTAERTEAAWYAMRERLRTHPARGIIGPSELDDLFTVGGYSDAVWPKLARAFSAYSRKGETGRLVKAFKRFVRNGTKEAENGYAVYLGVECRDAAWPRDWSVWQADSRRISASARFMTWPNAWYNAPCAFWPVRGGTPIKVGASKLPPILLIQSRRDAATPYQGAVRMRRLFPTSRLLTVGGGNHGVVLSGNTCADRRMTDYLLKGSLPRERGRGATCRRAPEPVPAGGRAGSGRGSGLGPGLGSGAVLGLMARIGTPFNL